MSDDGSDSLNATSTSDVVQDQPSAAGDETKLSNSQENVRKPVKKANKPFLVHQRWLAKQKEEKKEQERERRNGGGAARASSSGVGAGWNVTKWVLLALITSSMMSRSVTGTWGWGYEGKWSQWSNVSLVTVGSLPSSLTNRRIVGKGPHHSENHGVPIGATARFARWFKSKVSSLR